MSIQSHEIEILDAATLNKTDKPSINITPLENQRLQPSRKVSNVSSQRSLTIKTRPKSAMPKSLMKSKQVSFVDDSRRRNQQSF